MVLVGVMVYYLAATFITKACQEKQHLDVQLSEISLNRLIIKEISQRADKLCFKYLRFNQLRDMIKQRRRVEWWSAILMLSAELESPFLT